MEEVNLKMEEIDYRKLKRFLNYFSEKAVWKINGKKIFSEKESKYGINLLTNYYERLYLIEFEESTSCKCKKCFILAKSNDYYFSFEAESKIIGFYNNSVASIFYSKSLEKLLKNLSDKFHKILSDKKISIE